MTRLLIVKMSSIGDVLHAIPVVKSIKRDLPEVSIGWVVKQRCAGLLDGSDFIDKLHIVPNGMGLLQLAKLRTSLKNERYDVAFDMQGLFFSGLVTFLSGCRRRVGLNRNREMNIAFLTEPVVEGKVPGVHAMDVLKGFRAALGLSVTAPLPPVDYIGKKSVEWLLQFDKGMQAHQVVTLNVGASTIYKRWPNSRWIALGRALVELGCKVVLTAGPTESADSANVAAGIGSPAMVIDLGGRTDQDQLATILKKSDVVVSGDTGPMHLAATVGTPVVALFGPTDPRLTGPYGPEHRIIYKNLSCSPCFRHPTCNGRVDCLTSITDLEVLKEVGDLLSVCSRSALV